MANIKIKIEKKITNEVEQEIPFFKKSKIGNLLGCFDVDTCFKISIHSGYNYVATSSVDMFCSDLQGDIWTDISEQDFRVEFQKALNSNFALPKPSITKDFEREVAA